MNEEKKEEPGGLSPWLLAISNKCAFNMADEPSVSVSKDAIVNSF